MSLKAALKHRPVIYEIVPPRRDTSRFNTEHQGVEEVLEDVWIDAINIPELMTRKEEGGLVLYSPTTIPPEEYALMIKDSKEPIVNVIAPRLPREEFELRARRVLQDYKIENLVVVGKERHEDILPGPGVVEALQLLRGAGSAEAALGGICIFGRESGASMEYGHSHLRLPESKRVLAKARAGCDFVTSQIGFDQGPALKFLSEYSRACDEAETQPLTVFISITTVPSSGILALLEGLDVAIPPKVEKRLTASDQMGKESLKVAAEVLEGVVSESERRGDGVPLGLQIEQVGVKSGDLSLELLDRVHTSFS